MERAPRGFFARAAASRRSRRLVIGAALAALALGSSSCAYLRDKEPWTATVIYSIGDDGRFTVDPLVINADANVGIVQVVNETNDRHGFAVPDLAVFEEIAPGLTANVDVDEAKDDQTYLFTCQIHDEDDADGELEFEGQIVVNYLSEEFRR